jgi:hypothetical protein
MTAFFRLSHSLNQIDQKDQMNQIDPPRVGRLNEAVKRNEDRFPSDFTFQLTKAEFENLKSQIAISSSKWGGRRHAPYVFTEQGVAMLSSVLRSKRAIEVNIAIMRTFVRLREMISSNKVLARRLTDLKKREERVAWSSFCSRNAHDRGMEGHPRWSCAPGTVEGMEPDDLLCSRNARPEKALVGRAQWKINQPPSLGR